MRRSQPTALLVVCLLVLVEAAAMLGLAIAWLIDLLRGNAEIPGALAFLVAFSLGVAVLLAVGARGLRDGRRWARGPVMTWQILLVALSVAWIGNGAPAWTIPILAVALAVAAGLLLPTVVAATTARGTALPGEH